MSLVHGAGAWPAKEISLATGDPSKNISYQPTGALTYDPTEEAYWDPALLDEETRRTFEICHGCRMCFKFCDSFPHLFRFLDEVHDGDVRGLQDQEIQKVVEACFQCKLCEVQCPYTERDQHEYRLDFPKLVHRHQAIRRQKEAPSLRDRMLADPDQAGQMARMSLGLANALNKVPAHRWLMEKFIGIHREKLLPEFAPEAFDVWAQKEGRAQTGAEAEAVLFQTCYVQHNEPQIGRDVLEVLDKNQIQTVCLEGLRCCGMPSWEQGDLESLRRNAAHNLDLLFPHVERGAKVLAVNPTCSMVMRREHPELLDGRDRERAVVLASSVQDVGEFLWGIRREPRFSTDFRSKPSGPVAYHAPCHLRAQGVGFKGRDLLRKIPGVVPKTIMQCSGHDGTYAMKVEGFEGSQRAGKRAFEEMQAAEASLWVTECPLAALQFAQHAGKKALHPMSVLARAYRTDGFEEQLGVEGGDS